VDPATGQIAVIDVPISETCKYRGSKIFPFRIISREVPPETYLWNKRSKLFPNQASANSHLMIGKAMEALVKKGKVRSIGVSNFTQAKVESLLRK
jgi:hypothetical protein